MPQLDWDQEFSRVSEDVKGKGKARIEEVEVSSESKVDDPQMSEFQKSVGLLHPSKVSCRTHRPFKSNIRYAYWGHFAR